jgi:hypothetical protein
LELEGVNTREDGFILQLDEFELELEFEFELEATEFAPAETVLFAFENVAAGILIRAGTDANVELEVAIDVAGSFQLFD